jgi:hypothetical protein
MIYDNRVGTIILMLGVCVVGGEGWWAGDCGFTPPFSFLKEEVMHSHVIIHEALRAKFCYSFLLSCVNLLKGAAVAQSVM